MACAQPVLRRAGANRECTQGRRWREKEVVAEDKQKSEPLIVPLKPGNPFHGDSVEGRGGQIVEPEEGKMSETLCSGCVTTRLQRIAELASKNPTRVFSSVAHVIDVEWVREAYRRTRKDGAVGVDGEDAQAFAADLEGNLTRLSEELREGRYRPPPVRRAHIPKSPGQTRPIGIPTFGDKVAQRAVAMLVEAIYEQDFVPDSYGFRPGRSAHDALQELQKRPTYWGRCWVIEADIKSFFDTLDHGQLRKILDQRISDGVIRRLIDRWLNAGVLESGRVERAELGTPQGGVISPLLANIYLHDALDVWLKRDVRPVLRGGRMRLIRYADDFVILFGNEHDARRVMAVLGKRLGRYGLTLHPDKTRLLSFDSPGLGREGAQKERSFDFLGLTHYWGKSRKGQWVVKRKTAKDRFRRGLKKLKDVLRRMMHAPIASQHKRLSAMVRGHFNYFGVIGNGDGLKRFSREAEKHWARTLARRSDRAIGWRQFLNLLKRWPLPPVQIREASV
jgi:group II intron reverse transcriptase/maturase